MKHAILGAGAIGGLVGTVLSSLGEDVTVVVRPQKLAEYPANLTLERPSGAITAPTKAMATLTEPVGVLWIATKTYQLLAALETIEVLPRCVVPLLNGIEHVAVLRARLGVNGWSRGRSRRRRSVLLRASLSSALWSCI
jgi:2-dehydropantoate 2-reductase